MIVHVLCSFWVDYHTAETSILCSSQTLTPILRPTATRIASLSRQRIEYKVLNLSPTKLFSLDKLLISIAFSMFNLTVIVTLQRPPIRSRLKVTDRSFTHHATVIWNSLPKQLRQPSALQSLGNTTDSTTLLALSSHQFHSKLQTFLFDQSFPPKTIASTPVGSLAPWPS